MESLEGVAARGRSPYPVLRCVAVNRHGASYMTNEMEKSRIVYRKTKYDKKSTDIIHI